MVRMIQSRLAISLPLSGTSAIGRVSRDHARYSRSPARSSRVDSSTAPGILARAALVPLSAHPAAPISAHPATLRAVEPDMDLTGAGCVLVIGEELPRRLAVTPPQGAEHHQIV